MDKAEIWNREIGKSNIYCNWNLKIKQSISLAREKNHSRDRNIIMVTILQGKTKR